MRRDDSGATAQESHYPHPQPLPTRGRGAHRVRRLLYTNMVYRTAFNALKPVRCRPCASKFSGASQRSKAALRAGHSLSSME
jgi:hypothetical protein